MQNWEMELQLRGGSGLEELESKAVPHQLQSLEAALKSVTFEPELEDTWGQPECVRDAQGAAT